MTRLPNLRRSGRGLTEKRGIETMYDLDVLRRSETDRRAFLARMGAAGLGAAAVALLAGCGDDSSNNSSATPDLGATRSAFTFTPTNAVLGTAPITVPGANQNQVVLNFALTLEFSGGRPLPTGPQQSVRALADGGAGRLYAGQRPDREFRQRGPFPRNARQLRPLRSTPAPFPT